MIAIRFAASYNEHAKGLTSPDRLDSLFARSYKAKKNGRTVS